MTKEKLHKKSNEEKEKEAAEYKDKWMRTLASYENLKKRFEKEKIEFLKFSTEELLLQLLPIIDNFDRAHEVARQHKHGEVFSKGVEMILADLHKLLKENGVEKVKTVGEKFSPHVHEALMLMETDEYPEDTVAEEVSPGYILNGKLIRAAKVKISNSVKKDQKNAEENKIGGEDKNV